MKRMARSLKQSALIALILLLFLTGACAREVEEATPSGEQWTIYVTVDAVAIQHNDKASQKSKDLLDSLMRHALSDEGAIFFRGDVNIAPEQSAFHALRATGLDLRYNDSAFGPFVHAILGLGDKDAGPLSGWVYLVNGEAPDVSSGLYKLNDGDVLHWRYTVEETDLLRDLP